MQTQEKIYSPEEYLELEKTAEFRSEYHNGQIIPMAGGTPNHNRIALNLSAALNFAFKGQPYDVFMSDMRLWIPQEQLYTYPDVMVVPDPIQFAEGRRDTITNPIMIAEILSESTANYDRSKKFKLYRTIPSLREYILIEQSEIYVEQFAKTAEKKWILTAYESEKAELGLTSVPLQISLAELYDKVDFDSKE